MIINFDQLKNIRSDNKNKTIIICAGWFDMFHAGHLNFLNNAKKQGDMLVVVVMNDLGVKPLKGENRPYMPEDQRTSIVDNIKSVDFTIISENKLELSNFIRQYGISEDYKEQLLWKEYIPIIAELKPDKVFSLRETLNPSLIKYLDNKGIEVLYTNYYEGVSTTLLSKAILSSDHNIC